MVLQAAVAGSLPALSAELPTAAPPAVGNGQATSSTVAARPELSSVTLSAQQRQVSQIADRNGDRDFLMIDKYLGTIILFQNGKPVFSASALSGESTADRLPPDAYSRKYSRMDALAYRVTPAGRFMATRYIDENYGPSFKFNEIRGPDWVLSLHQVYLGAPSERRAYRLQSSDPGDNKVTPGAINVSLETIQFLMENLPKEGPTAVYILPHDRDKTAEYFAPPSGTGSLAPASRSADVGQAVNSTDQAQPKPPADPLSPQEQHVSVIAGNNGDQTYLMVDKVLGKILLFEDGTPVFSAPALTGESVADSLPPSALKKSFSSVGTKDDKVTPAGRFTLTRDYDKSYGTLLEIKEIRGPDWAIAIHRVYLGTPSERRKFRMDTRNARDNNVSHGCINVAKETIEFLLRKLPPKPVPVLYVLPHDTGKTEAYLARRGGV